RARFAWRTALRTVLRTLRPTLRPTLRASLLRARVRAPFRAAALRAAALRPRDPPVFFLAAAILSLHDAVGHSPQPDGVGDCCIASRPTARYQGARYDDRLS